MRRRFFCILMVFALLLKAPVFAQSGGAQEGGGAAAEEDVQEKGTYEDIWEESTARPGEALADGLASGDVATDYDGELEISWSFYGGTLWVSGSGWTEAAGNVPWESIKQEIVNAFFEEGTERICRPYLTGCANLKKVTVPSTVESIDAGSFTGCNSLLEIEVAKGNGYYDVEDGVLYEQEDGLERSLLCYPAARPGKAFAVPKECGTVRMGAFDSVDELEELRIGAYRIEPCAILRCKQLNQVWIGENVGELEGTSIICNDRLTSIETDPRNETYCSVDGVLYDADRENLYTVPTDYPKERFVIASGMLVIEQGAFAYNKNIREVFIPRSVGYMGEGAFFNMEKVKEIMLCSPGITFSGNPFLLDGEAPGQKLCAFTVPNEEVRGKVNATLEECGLEDIGLILSDRYVKAESVSLNKTELSLGIAGTFQLEAYILPDDHSELAKWSSSNENVAVVYQGMVYALYPGECIITASCGDAKAECRVTVKKVMISPEEVSEMYTFVYARTVLGVPTGKRAIWKSSNPRIVSIDDEGNFEALKKGKAKLTAISDGVKYTVKVVVINPVLSAKSQKLKVTHGQKLSVQGALKEVRWISKKPNVVSVDSEGNIKAMKPGSATVIARIGNVKLKCTVKVTKAVLNRKTLKLNAGGEGANLFIDDILDPVEWRSSNPAAAAVDAQGHVVPLAKGKAVITGKFANTAMKCKVTVRE